MGNFNVVFNKQRVSYNGISSLYIRIRIDRQKKEIPLDIRWPVDKFDHENGLCRERFPGDQEASDNNMIIRTEIGNVNKLFKHYRLSEIPLQMSKVVFDLKHNYSHNDFISFMEARIKDRFRDRDITQPTYVNHMKAVKKMRAAFDQVLFADFDENWGKRFDNYLRRTMNTQMNDNINSRWGIHKVIKTYVLLARRNSIIFTNPYQYFRIRPTRGSWTAIFENDIRKLYKYYHSKRIPPMHKKVLRGFLFCCMTGLRISDLARVTSAWLQHGILSFIPFKGRKKNRWIEIPLNKIALEMFKDARADHPVTGSCLFFDIAPQAANDILKVIAGKCHIKTRLHHHVGRHTFITTFYNRTKDLVAAQAFAGHENISTTMIYTHNNPEASREKMKAMDGILTN